MAIYHTGHKHYTGTYPTQGGYGQQQYGGAGTVFIEQVSSNTQPQKRTLLIDNNKVTASNRIREVERLPLKYRTQSTDRKEVFTYTGVHIKTTSAGLVTHPSRYHYHYHDLNCIIHTCEQDLPYAATHKRAIITLTLPFTTYIDHVRIFPECRLVISAMYR